MNKRTAAAATTVIPDAVVRTMIVCVSDELSQVLDSTRNLERHLGVSGTSCPQYWASPAVYPWQRRQLIDLRKAKTGPRYPVRKDPSSATATALDNTGPPSNVNGVHPPSGPATTATAPARPTSIVRRASAGRMQGSQT